MYFQKDIIWTFSHVFYFVQRRMYLESTSWTVPRRTIQLLPLHITAGFCHASNLLQKNKVIYYPVWRTLWERCWEWLSFTFEDANSSTAGQNVFKWFVTAILGGKAMDNYLQLTASCQYWLFYLKSWRTAWRTFWERTVSTYLFNKSSWAVLFEKTSR